MNHTTTTHQKQQQQSLQYQSISMRHRFDWSLNSIIKILVIVCLVAHLLVLQNTTQTMIFDSHHHATTGTVSTTATTTTISALDMDLPSRIPGSDPTERREEESSPLVNITGTTQQQHDQTIQTFHPGRTFNITEYYMATTTNVEHSQRPHGYPINALDLMTHHPEIPLPDLVHTDPNPTCKKGRAQKSLFPAVVNHLDRSVTHPPGRYIPKIIHVTSKTRCMPPVLHDNLQHWANISDHTLYVHDDAAVHRLLFETYWPEFPHLNVLRHCMISGAAMADLWRYLVLYQYGGIYTDMDAAPGPQFFHNGSTTIVIQDSDQAWLVVERIGIPSQYFMASAPKHPLMYLLVTVTLRRLLEVTSVGEQYVPYVTGPGALKEAWQHFLYQYPQDQEEEGEGQEPPQQEEEKEEQDSTGKNDADNGNTTTAAVLDYNVEQTRRRLLENTTDNTYGMVPKKRRKGLQGGVYVGMLNWTVTIAGHRGNTKQFVNREAVKKKKNHWKSMGMRHFQHAKDHYLNMTCYERIYQMSHYY